MAPREVEDVLQAHPPLQDAVVAQVIGAEGVMVLKAFVVAADPGNDADLASDLGAWCRGRLASYKRPRAWEVVPALPRTPSGKLRRFVLRDGSPSRG